MNQLAPSAFLLAVVSLCHGQQCESPPVIEYGSVGPTRTLTRNILCNRGFVLRGPPNITCTLGRWSAPGYCYTESLTKLIELEHRCNHNSDCHPLHSVCVTGKNGCARCGCPEGYGFRSDINQCRKLTAIGDFCQKDLDCYDAQAICGSKGKCKCTDGYVPGPLGFDCQQASATASAGQGCYQDANCLDGARCSSGACGCPATMSLVRGTCVYNKPGSSCSSADHCSSSNVECKDNVCQCVPPFTMAEIQVDAETSKTVCINGDQESSIEGEACSAEDGPDGIDGPVCDLPFVCETCGSSKGTCVKPEDVYTKPKEETRSAKSKQAVIESGQSTLQSSVLLISVIGFVLH